MPCPQTRSRTAAIAKKIGDARRAAELHYFDTWSKKCAFMAPYGSQSKAQKKAYARYLAKFMRLTKSLPLSEWGRVHSTITKNVRAKWLVRWNNADDLEPLFLLELRSMKFPPILTARASWLR